jgi:hypothetical protein
MQLMGDKWKANLRSVQSKGKGREGSVVML